MKNIDLNIHENQDKLKQEVLETIRKIPATSDGNILLTQDLLFDLCFGYYKKGFDLGVLETMKTIRKNPEVTDIEFNLDLPI